jgi:hypothetical protein
MSELSVMVVHQLILIAMISVSKGIVKSFSSDLYKSIADNQVSANSARLSGDDD